jgi:endonuclease/exonuclease/phosphatase family metal-dependent hydrolase
MKNYNADMYLLICLLFLLFAVSCSRDIVIMSYNVQNLFDDKNDGTEYPEFRLRPGRWSAEMYADRLHNLADVILKSAPSGPEIIALQEIENRKALDDLGLLLGHGSAYPYKCMVPVTGSATNTAILSKYPIMRVGAYATRQFEGKPLRNILEAEIAVGVDILYIFCNHWKSREGGVLATEPARLEEAAMLKKRISVISRENPKAQIIVAGDLNENADEYSEAKAGYETAIIAEHAGIPDGYLGGSIEVTGDATRVSGTENTLVLFEPWLEEGIRDNGSYVFGNKWETIDHILLSAGLFDEYGLAYVWGSFKAVRLSFLIDRETGFPVPWDQSTKKGYSDHLPVLLELRMK